GHAEIAVTFGDFTGQARTDRTIAIADIETEFATGFAFDCRLRRCPYFPGFGRFIEWRIRFRMTELGLAFRLRVFPKNRRQIQVALFRRRALTHAEQIGAADQLFHRTHTDARHPLARFLRHKAEEIHHHFNRADEMVIAQALVLGGDTGGAIVEVTD